MQPQIWFKAALAGSAAATAVLTAAPGLAHHSFGPFDQTTTVELEGVVTKFDFTNPHSWVHLRQADGKVWSVETAGPGVWTMQGWKRSDLKPGDKVSVVAHPNRTGAPQAHIITLKAHGKQFLDVSFGPRYFRKLGLPVPGNLGGGPPEAPGGAPATQR